MLDLRDAVPPALDETGAELLPDGSMLVELGDDTEDEAPQPSRDVANLAELMTPEDRAVVASDLMEAIERDDKSRAERVEKWKETSKIVGLEPDDRPGLFENASKAVDPLLLEVATRFHARALAETAPPGGPIRAQVLGQQTDDAVAQADRVKNRLNYWAVEEAQEWLDDHDKLLFYLPYMGSMFKKVWQHPMLARPTSRMVWPDAVIVDYHARDIDDARRVTHKVPPLSRSEMQWMQDQGIYLADDLGEPDPFESEGMREVADRFDGRTLDTGDDKDAPYELYECHTALDLSQWIEGEPEGEQPVIVTIAKAQTPRLLALHKNTNKDGRPKEWFVHYMLYPGPGFYGLSFLDLLGRIQEAATGSLRALFDSAMFSNMQGGFVTNSFKAPAHNFRMTPGKYIQVDMSAEDLAKSFYTPPFKEPSPALENLRQSVRESGRQIGAVSDAAIGEIGRADVPVGTMMAALEQSSQPTSALHLRLYRAMRREFRIVARLMGEHMPEQYPYRVAGDEKISQRSDFDDRVDVIPVCDPSSPTKMHRVQMAQMRLQALAGAPPGMFDLRQAYRDLIVAIDPDGAERLAPEKDDAPSLDPVSENVRIMANRPVRATISQDHDAHMAAHGAILQLISSMPAMAPVAPMIQQAVTAHMAEHMAHKYAVMMGNMLGIDPMLFVTEGEDDEEPGIPAELEGAIAKPAAEATAAFVQQVMQAMGGGAQGQGDPMAIMAQAELEKAKAAKMGAEARMMAAQLAEKDSERDYEVSMKKLGLDAAKSAATIESSERKTAAQIEAK